MNLVVVEYYFFSFKKIPFKLSHSSANRSGEDERQWARFNIVIVTGTNMALTIEKYGPLFVVSLLTRFQLFPNLYEFHSDER